MIPARVLCNPDFWPSIQADSEILRRRIAPALRVRMLRRQMAETFERLGRAA